MKKNIISMILLCSLSLGFLAACGNSSNTQIDNDSAVAEVAEAATEASTSSVQVSTDDDIAESIEVSSDQESNESTDNESEETTAYTTVSNTINLSDYEANSVVTINAAGEYTLSGTLNDGQVVVDVGDDEEVQLYLNNAEITHNSGSAILVQNAEKVTITLMDGTNNVVSDGANYTNLDQDGEPDAAIFAHDDLTINGSGSLTVVANYSDGIESRDDLKITGGNITITAVDIGLFGNNSFEMKTAAVVITAGGDTIHSDGDILIESGTLTLISGDDGMHADGTLTINDGAIDIQMSYEGLEATDVVINGGVIGIIATDDGINGAGGNDNSGNAPNGRQDNFTGSQCSITVTGGTITITAATSGNGDGLDANGSITISGGEMVIKVPSSYRDYSNIDYNTSFSLIGGNVQLLYANGTYSQVTASNITNNPMGGGHGGK